MYKHQEEIVVFIAFLEKGLKELSVVHKPQPRNSITVSICTNITFLLNYTFIYCYRPQT